MARFHSIGCPLMLRTNYRCVQSLNISVDVAKCVENVHKFNQFTHFLSVTKNDLSWLNNLFMARFQLIRMSSYAKNKLQMCSVTQHQCIRRQMCGKCSQIHPVHSLFVLQKMTCHDWTIYANNKLQMCSVTSTCFMATHLGRPLMLELMSKTTDVFSHSTSV